MNKTLRISAMITILTSSTLYSAPGFVAEHAHRQHDAHEHGVAQLNIAQQDHTLHLELNSPAMNIVGFEHSPRNKQQAAHVAQAVTILQNGTQVFLLTAAAGCKLGEIDVHTSMLKSSHAHDKTNEDSHADFSAHYVFNCAQISALRSIEIKLFTLFPATTELAVQLLTDKGQTAEHLSASKPVLHIK